MSCPCLEDSTILWLVQNGPRSWPVLFRLVERQRACEKIFEEILFLVERLNVPKKLRKFKAKTSFFFENAWIFRKFYEFLEQRPFFSLEITSALFTWSLALVSRGSVLGRVVLGLGFFCVLGLEPCILDSNCGLSSLPIAKYQATASDIPYNIFVSTKVPLSKISDDVIECGLGPHIKNPGYAYGWITIWIKPNTIKIGIHSFPSWRSGPIRNNVNLPPYVENRWAGGNLTRSSKGRFKSCWPK